MDAAALSQAITGRDARIAALTERNADLERIAKYVGVCMSCIHGSHDPNGCTDCLGTGWEQGVDPIKRNAALEKELADAKEQIAKAQEDEWEKWSIEFEGDAEVLGEIIRRQARKISNYYHRFKYQSKAFATITAERDKAVKDEREACARIVESYAAPNRFTPSEQWKSEYTVAQVYETGAIDISIWAANEIRARATLDGIREAKAPA